MLTKEEFANKQTKHKIHVSWYDSVIIINSIRHNTITNSENMSYAHKEDHQIQEHTFLVTCMPVAA